ncbi:MAG: FtsB family cell division protein [Shimia sp.]
MHRPQRPPLRPSLGLIGFCTVCLLMGAVFVFNAVQGEFGLFARAEIAAEARALRTELATVQERIAALENKTRRLGDDFLDLDLLDERARDVLGYVRTDEVVVR